MLESTQVPDAQAVVPLIRAQVIDLGIQYCEKVKIYGRRSGEDFPDWQQEFDLEKQVVSPSFTTEASVKVQPSILSPEIEQEKQLLQSAQVPQAELQIQEAKKTEELSIWGSLFGVVAGAAGAVGGAVVQAGGAVSDATVQAGQAVVGTSVGVGEAIASAVLQAPEGVGYLLGLVGDSPQLQQLTKALNVDWLVSIIDQVDIVKAETHVKRLQQKYPHEQASEIAHRLMVEKSIYVGGSGLASSILPGFAAALLAVDLAATTAIQAEMVYQITCAYGFDLQEPARKGEIIAIFGLAFSGNCAVKAGIGFLRNVPIAGAVVGALHICVMI